MTDETSNLKRVKDFNTQLRKELNRKTDLLNCIYSLVFPDYVPPGRPLCSMPFGGNDDSEYERKLIDAIREKFEDS